MTFDEWSNRKHGKTVKPQSQAAAPGSVGKKQTFDEWSNAKYGKTTEVGGLDRTEYNDNPQRASNHVAEMGKVREERAAEKQWYDKYSNLNVDLAAAAQRAAEAGQKNVQDEIYQLTQQANLYFSNNMEEERSEALKRLEHLEGLDVESSANLQQLRQDIATAQYLQKQQMYAGKQAAADTYAASQPASGRWTAEEIDQKIQETDNRLQMLNASGQFEEADALKVELDRLYQLRRVSEYGQDSERNMYDYLQSEDPAEAQAYLQHLQETMNYRKGMDQVSDIRGIDNDILRTLAIGAHSVGTGMANAGAGFNQLLSEEAIPTTAMQYASEELMGDLGMVGRLLYSAGSTVGNMLPTILLSVGLGAAGVPGAVAGGIASSAMGASVAGNTYTQAVKEGYAPDKAKTYAALVGASEAALQYLLGGIGKLGGVADDAILAKVKTIDNVLARMALTGAVKIGSEVGEEELQLFLEPAIRSVVFSEGYNVPQMEEIIETAVVSALSTGLLEGPGIISAGFERPDMGSNPVQASEPAVDPVMAQAAEMLKRDSAKKADGEPLASAPAAAAEVPQTSSAQKNAPSSAAPAVLQNEQVQDTEVANAVLRSAAKGFGKEGAQNLLLAYDGQSSTNYLGGFRVYYEAGLSGRGMDKVESVFSGYLTDNQKQLAYGAGQIDAARSLEAEIGAVASATVYGKEAGLMRNQEAAKLDRTVASSLNKLGKATGVKILVEDMAEGVNGSFDVKSGIIRLNAKATNPLLTVAAHEVTHRMQQMSPKEYRAFRDFAVNAISEQIGSSAIREIEARYARNDVKLTHEEAMDEVAAEFAEAMVKDETLFRKLTQENRTAAQKFVDAVKAFIEKVKAAFSKDSKTQDSHAMQKYGVDMQTLEAAAKKWEAVLQATENTVHRMDVEGVIQNTAGNEVGYSDGNGHTRFSLKTWREGGRAALRTWLDYSVKDGAITRAESRQMLEQMDQIYDVCQKFTGTYAGFSAWSEAEVVRDEEGNPAFSVVKKNGEYALNLDFSLVCKKRRTLDAVFNEMIRQGMLDRFDMGQRSIVAINDIIREHGFETACALCFVDAKRFRQADIAGQFVDMYNRLVNSMAPKGAEVASFNFGGDATVQEVTNGIDQMPDDQLNFKMVDAVLAAANPRTVNYKIAQLLKESPENRKLVARGDFMSTAGFDKLNQSNHEVLRLYNSKKGSGGPKAAQSDVQYLSEILEQVRFNQKNAYAVGGVRIQSFSDYVPRMVFDYVQMIGDLAAKKLPAHAYTKEELFALQFGKTGIKVNMSLVPRVVEGGAAPGLDAEGNYAWQAGQSFGSNVNDPDSGNAGFELAKQIQNADGYSANCGTIAVGISDRQIRKMLDDPDIRMIIPYHKSSLNHQVAVMNSIHKFTDYTKVQNTRTASGKKISGEDFNFNDSMRDLGDAKAAADEYLEWCKEHGYKPKFDQFADHPNYYKLLEDFNCYDASGAFAAQGEVSLNFPVDGDPFGSMTDLIERGLEEDAVLEGSRDAAVQDIVDEIARTLPDMESRWKAEDLEKKGKKKNHLRGWQDSILCQGWRLQCVCGSDGTV